MLTVKRPILTWNPGRQLESLYPTCEMDQSVQDDWVSNSTRCLIVLCGLFSSPAPAESLSDNASAFSSRAKQLHRRMWWRDVKVCLLYDCLHIWSWTFHTAIVFFLPVFNMFCRPQMKMIIALVVVVILLIIISEYKTNSLRFKQPRGEGLFAYCFFSFSVPVILQYRNWWWWSRAFLLLLYVLHPLHLRRPPLQLGGIVLLPAAGWASACVRSRIWPQIFSSQIWCELRFKASFHERCL